MPNAKVKAFTNSPRNKSLTQINRNVLESKLSAKWSKGSRTSRSLVTGRRQRRTSRRCGPHRRSRTRGSFSKSLARNRWIVSMEMKITSPATTHQVSLTHSRRRIRLTQPLLLVKTLTSKRSTLKNHKWTSNSNSGPTKTTESVG